MCKVCETAERADKARARAAHPSGGLRQTHDYFNAVSAYHAALIEEGQRNYDEATKRDDIADAAMDVAVEEVVASLMRAGLIVMIAEEPPF